MIGDTGSLRHRDQFLIVVQMNDRLVVSLGRREIGSVNVGNRHNQHTVLDVRGPLERMWLRDGNARKVTAVGRDRESQIRDDGVAASFTQSVLPRSDQTLLKRCVGFAMATARHQRQTQASEGENSATILHTIAEPNRG